MTDGDYQALLVTSAEGTAVVDAPPSLAPYLRAAVAEVSSAPVTQLIYSHSHYDHIGAAHVFEDATVISHAEVANTLRRRNDPRRPVPDVTFQDRLTVEVGGQQLMLEYRGPNHEPGNLFIHLPLERVAPNPLVTVNRAVPSLWSTATMPASRCSRWSATGSEATTATTPYALTSSNSPNDRPRPWRRTTTHCASSPNTRERDHLQLRRARLRSAPAGPSPQT